MLESRLYYEDEPGERVDVRAANSRVGDFNVNVGFLESLWLIALPDHVALGGIGVEADPAFEFVVGRHVGMIG